MAAAASVFIKNDDFTPSYIEDSDISASSKGFFHLGNFDYNRGNGFKANLRTHIILPTSIIMLECGKFSAL